MSEPLALPLAPCIPRTLPPVPRPNPTLKARQLESLVRLSEARARIDLREEVTKNDAEVSQQGDG